MKDFFDTWKFKILVAVAVFLVGIMAYAGANGRLTAAPQELLGVVLMPLQKVTSALSGGDQKSVKKFFHILGFVCWLHAADKSPDPVSKIIRMNIFWPPCREIN